MSGPAGASRVIRLNRPVPAAWSTPVKAQTEFEPVDPDAFREGFMQTLFERLVDLCLVLLDVIITTFTIDAFNLDIHLELDVRSDLETQFSHDDMLLLK
jgi:hypothetical protein